MSNRWMTCLVGVLCLSPLVASCTPPAPTMSHTEMEKAKVLTNQEAWKIYQTYVDGWKAISDDERAKIVAEITSPDIRYRTPNHESTGRQTVTEHMAAFQAKFAGGRFDVGDVSAHHDVAILTWVLVQADGTVFARGHDQLQVSPDGRIASVITFAPPQIVQPLVHGPGGPLAK